MIFADKLIALRKKAGWSQEELAAQLNVTRQSVSKWEGAQSIPDIERILQLSRLFNVSTDFLLKDDLAEEERLPAEGAESTPPVRRVTMEEASAFLMQTHADAPKMALGVFLCIISPVCLLMLAVLSDVGGYGISEAAAAGIGVSVLLVMVAIAVSIFILCASRVKEYEFLEKEEIETEYGVRGMVSERKRAFTPAYVRTNIIACAMCIVAAVPVILSGALSLNDVSCVGAVCVLLVIVGVAVGMFVRVGMYHGAMNKLLEEGNYTRENKAKSRIKGTVSVIYWLIVTAVFLIYTYGPQGNGQPQYSWVVWAVGGVLYAAVLGLVELFQRRG